MKSYDDNRIELPLRTCPVCQHDFYMHAVICMTCRESWPAAARSPLGADVSPTSEVGVSAPAIDVNGNLMDGP